MCFFITKDLFLRSGDENKNDIEDASLNTFSDVLIQEHHKQFYDNHKNIICCLHGNDRVRRGKMMTWQLMWQVTWQVSCG
jgi:hypothetical protein